ncbi:2Fe-2S iron-sulfur cluster binding domain-containing protein [bacterium]|nr:2Fe-2S iron-sulfur cluster binding domain-containing protein [bacterium]
MPTVRFEPSGKTTEIKAGTSLYDAAIQAGLPVAASCAAEFVCGKCNMRVLEGSEHLSKQTAKERHLLQQQARPETDRVSCRTAIWGDCTVTTTYW